MNSSCLIGIQHVQQPFTSTPSTHTTIRSRRLWSATAECTRNYRNTCLLNSPHRSPFITGQKKFGEWCFTFFVSADNYFKSFHLITDKISFWREPRKTMVTKIHDEVFFPRLAPDYQKKKKKLKKKLKKNTYFCWNRNTFCSDNSRAHIKRSLPIRRPVIKVPTYNTVNKTFI